MNVLSIGYGRHLFDKKNAERKRMEACAEAVGSLDMIVFTDRSDGLSVESSETGLKIYPTNSSSKLTMMFDAYSIAVKIIKRQSSLPIVTSQDPFETGLIGYFLKRKFGVHLTVQEHADVYSASYWKEETFLNRVRHKIGYFVLKRADTVRVVSDRIAEALKEIGVKEQRIKKLPVAINVSEFEVPKGVTQNVRTFPVDVFTFLTVARFVPQKNLGLLVRSFLKVYKTNNRVRLQLVGAGQEEELLKTMISANFSHLADADKPIQILPWTDDVPGLMANSDAYVLSSNYEGWARVLIESMCMNLPIVTTNVGCANEVVKDGEYGYVVPVNDESRLAEAMLDISTNRETYCRIKNNLEALDKSTVSGVNMSEYGKEWASALV